MGRKIARRTQVDAKHLVQTRVSEDTYEKLRALADAMHMSDAAFVKFVLEMAVDPSTFESWCAGFEQVSRLPAKLQALLQALGHGNVIHGDENGGK